MDTERRPDRESRIFPVVSVIVVFAVLALLPGRYRVLPIGVPLLVALVLVGLMLAAGFAPTNSRVAWLERVAIGLVAVFIVCVEVVGLGQLLFDMATGQKGIPGLTLLTTSVAVWMTNVLVFALTYWQVDRGGPSGRVFGWQGEIDFAFPRGEMADGSPVDRKPSFADYLFLAFNTSTAFSPTDTLPLTQRAKMLMLAQSLISLVTLVAVAARAINILGTPS